MRTLIRREVGLAGMQTHGARGVSTRASLPGVPTEFYKNGPICTLALAQRVRCRR